MFLPARCSQRIDAFLVVGDQSGSGCSDLSCDVNKDIVVRVCRTAAAQRSSSFFDDVKGRLPELHSRFRQLIRLAGHVPRWQGVILQQKLSIVILKRLALDSYFILMWKHLIVDGVSPGLVVRGTDSCLSNRKFESQCRKIDGSLQAFICCKNRFGLRKFSVTLVRDQWPIL